jgi:hypothetical protein
MKPSIKRCSFKAEARCAAADGLLAEKALKDRPFTRSTDSLRLSVGYRVATAILQVVRMSFHEIIGTQ